MPTEKMATLTISMAAAAMAIIACTGCASTQGLRDPLPPSPAPLIATQFGEVVSVNRTDGYVVVECAVLPKEGEELTLYQGNGQTGRVKINRYISGSFAAADVLEGEPEKGDRFLVTPPNPVP